MEMRNLKWKEPLMAVLAVLLLVGIVFSDSIYAQSKKQAENVDISSDSAVIEQGSFGGNINWVLYESGELIISGSGKMKDWEDPEFRPWDGTTICNQIKKIVVEKGVTAIGDLTFNGCTEVTDIDLPVGLTSIGRSAFSGCESLTDIEIPSEVTSIGRSAFSGCGSLTDIEIPSEVTSIGTGAFGFCDSLNSISVVEENKVYSTYDGILYNKDRTVLLQCPGGKSSIMFPEGLIDIGDRAFWSCEGLSDISLPEGVKHIGDSSFAYSRLSSINLPESLVEIGNHAFADCSLTAIKLPKEISDTGESTFWGCKGLISVELSEKVESIGGYAFYGCSSLTHIELPENLISIGELAFEGCSSLTDIEIPSGVTNIGTRAFGYCNSLNSINVVEENKVYSTYDGILYNKDKSILLQYPGGKDTIAFPKGVASIGKVAFCGCKNLRSICLPQSITDIGDYAFAYSDLRNISLSEGVKSIGEWAFDGCESLNTINLPDSLTNIGEGAFFGCRGLTIYGEEGSYAQMYAEENEIPFQLISLLIKVSTITLTPSEAELKPGETLLIEAVIAPVDAVDKQLKWSSSNPEVASVDNGLVTAIGEGSTTITAESQDGSNVSASCSITVQKSEPTPIEKEYQSIIGTSSYSKTYGDAPFQLDIALEKGNGALSYASSNPKAAEVSGTGEVKITGAGSTTVTASETEQFKKCEYQVFIKVAKAAQRISGKSSYSKVIGGGQFRLDAKRMSGNGSLSYHSANRTVATVSNGGMVTIKKPGNTVITVTAAATPNYNACTFRIKLSVTAPKKGTTLTDSKTKARYKVTKQGKSVEYLKPKDKKVTKVSIPATVTISGVKYNVTAIASNALSGCKKLKAVTIGKNVESIGTKAFASCTALGKLTLPAKASKIGKQAFANCSKLKDITIQSTKLTAKSIGIKAFQGIHAKATIKVPKAKRAAYQKLLKSKGIGKKVKVK